ncbi:MAG: C-GCAxxG-C-C family (seleno)protein [Phycisphaerae bacterium]|jgi:hypothetical protein
MVDKAQKLYHGEEHYNCAQAVLAAFKERYDVPQEMIDSFSAFGGGRAEGNTCGALHAAMELAKERGVEIEQDFVREAGSAKCREIRMAKFPCVECVKLAARILDSKDTRQ